MESKNFAEGTFGDNIYQKGFKDGYEMAMKMLNNVSFNNTISHHYDTNQSLIDSGLNTNLHYYDNNKSLIDLNHNKSSQKSDNYYQKNMNEKQVQLQNNNRKVKKNKQKYDELEEYVEHFTIILQTDKTLEDIIAIITRYLNKINEKKLLILLNGNLDNYVFLNKDYKFNNLKYLSKFICNRFKLSMNIDLYININLNYNKKEYHIVVDKYKNPSNKPEKIILIQ